MLPASRAGLAPTSPHPVRHGALDQRWAKAHAYADRRLHAMTMLPPPSPKKLGLVIDLDTCVGCHACAVACKEWNDGGQFGPLPDENPYGKEPLGVWFNRVHTYEVTGRSGDRGLGTGGEQQPGDRLRTFERQAKSARFDQGRALLSPGPESRAPGNDRALPALVPALRDAGIA